MQLTKLDVDSKLKSTVKYGSIAFPLGIYFDEFSKYDIGYIRWHWHREFELAVITSGSVTFFFLNEIITLSKGEGIFINSNILHQIKPVDPNSSMIAIVFDPILLSGEKHSIIDKKYVSPIIENSNINFIKLNTNLTPKLYEIYELYKDRLFGYELLIRNSICDLWILLISKLNYEIKPSYNNDKKRIKTMLKYIHNNYYKKILLEEIASSVHISKSECCRSFQKYLKISPFEYLMEYRITKASELIKFTDKPLYEIAYIVGFNDTSYFAKIFKRFTNISPKQYRNQNKT